MTGDQASPVEGAGHDYIKMLNETVNPATGSVSDLLRENRTRLSMILNCGKGQEMTQNKFSEAVMIGALKQLEAGRKAEDVGREVGVSKHTIYAWKAKYGGMTVSEAQEAKQLRDENTRLKKLVVDLSLDKEMLKALIAKNGWSSEPAVGCKLAAGGIRSERAPGLRADDDGGFELSLSGYTLR